MIIGFTKLNRKQKQPEIFGNPIAFTGMNASLKGAIGDLREAIKHYLSKP